MLYVFYEGTTSSTIKHNIVYLYLLHKCFSYNSYISENFVNKRDFIWNSNASPSFTCTISVGKFALGITFINKLHNEALLPFLILPSLKSENEQLVSLYSKHCVVFSSRSARKMSRQNSIRGLIFTTSLSVFSVLCNLAKVTVFPFRGTFADVHV